MKISVDGQKIFELTETQKKVIQNDIPTAQFEEDMKRRLHWILVGEKYTKCMARLKAVWMETLAQRYESIPTNDDALAELIFAQPDYENRTQRDAREAAEKAAREAQAV
jgi:hypothetical protein